MSSPVVQVADAVVQAINAGPGYSQPVTAVRSYRGQYELQELGSLKVVVIPATLGVEPFDRGHDAFDVQIDVGVLKKLTSGAGTAEREAEMDGLLQLAGELIDNLRRRKLVTALDTRWVSLAVEPLWDPESYVKRHEFISVLKVTYSVRR